MQRNVLIVIESLAHRGGTETQLLELISRVDPSRFRLHVFCFEQSTPPLEVPPPHTVQVAPVEKLNSLAAIRQIFQLRAYIRRSNIDLVQTFMFKGSAVGVFAACGSGCRAIVTSRRNLGFACGHRVIGRVLNALTTRILANSEAVKSAAVKAEKVSPAKIDVLHNGVDLERFSRLDSSDEGLPCRIGIPTGVPIIGMVANLRPVKDIPFFLKAAREVAAEVPETVFLVIGDGPLKPELEACAAQLGIRERVFFAGGTKDVADWLGHMKIACLSSVAEGFSNSILEYMAAKLPVVATAVGGNPEAIVHGTTGYLVKDRSVAVFAQYITSLLRDEEKRKAMGQRAYDRCCEFFDIEQMVHEHEKYWERLIQQGPCSASARRLPPIRVLFRRPRWWGLSKNCWGLGKLLGCRSRMRPS